MEKLVKRYPKSKHYIESQFRLAENAFSARQFAIAEDKYTEVIGSKKNNIFYEKSLYKRGWSRFKQGFYTEAVDDFLQVVKTNRFDKYSELKQSKKELFNEYFRAIGLSFSYLGGAESLDDYFKGSPEFNHLYDAYSNLSDIYLKEDRNNDAVDTLNYFAKNNPHSPYVPEALLKTISIWKAAGFTLQLNATLESFYATYHPDSRYWQSQQNIDQRVYKLVKNTLREHILMITANHHKNYQLTHKHGDFLNAERWYKNYLKHYDAYSRKDNIHFLYASLLAENKDHTRALHHYELAAYDADIIIDKKSAYETILLTSQLSSITDNEKNISLWLNKLIHYSTLYGQQYPNDKQTINIISHASELAYKHNMFEEAVALAELIPGVGSTVAEIATNINVVKAHSYVKLDQHKDAENTYLAVLKNNDLSMEQKSSALDGLALTIYYQGKSASDRNKIDEAIRHYARIIHLAPDNPTAATGMYNAITLSMKNEYWKQAINFIKSFQRQFPAHQYSHDISRKLSVAYLNSKQDIAAAKELEQLSKHEQDKEFSIAALWKAGELYESNKDYHSAIRTYKQYAKQFTRPFPQYMESMLKLVTLYIIVDDMPQVSLWQNNIIQADKKVATSLKTERTIFIASTATLDLARKSHIDFTNAKLILPLKMHLKNKKQAMQRAVNLYGRAASYSVAEISTEATHAIGEIFYEFNHALLQSERPKHLNKDELEQYQFLLEDQAFPFEEKAIEFYETNLSHIKDDVYDEWVQKSHARLKKLFPVRYQREARLDGHINVLH